MAGVLIGTVTQAAPVGGAVAFSGGVAQLSMSGTYLDPSSHRYPGPRVILENMNAVGEWQPAGDATIGEGETQLVQLPACDVRARLTGGDAATSIEVYLGE